MRARRAASRSRNSATALVAVRPIPSPANTPSMPVVGLTMTRPYSSAPRTRAAMIGRSASSQAERRRHQRPGPATSEPPAGDPPAVSRARSSRKRQRPTPASLLA